MGKRSKKAAGKPTQSTPLPATIPQTGGAAAAVAPAPLEPATPWIDSSDPRRRLIGRIVFVGIWIYVAALWLLALDQTFDWGIFGPKTPPLP